MPLYEYECEACGARFEVIQRFADAPIKSCRQCQGPVHKLISSAAIQFKGTGWYITDYAKKNGSGPSRPSEGAKQDSKQDSKPAASPAPSPSAGASSGEAGGTSAKKD